MTPPAISLQNSRSISRRGGGRPGERIAALPVAIATHSEDRPIPTSVIEVLPRPVESADYTSHQLERELRRHGALASMGSVADCFDNALAESVFATLECELFDQQPGA